MTATAVRERTATSLEMRCKVKKKAGNVRLYRLVIARKVNYINGSAQLTIVSFRYGMGSNGTEHRLHGQPECRL